MTLKDLQYRNSNNNFALSVQDFDWQSWTVEHRAPTVSRLQSCNCRSIWSHLMDAHDRHSMRGPLCDLF